MIEANHQQYEIQLRSPMGWIKVKAGLVLDSETDFHGEVKLMGLTVPLEDCSRTGETYQFKASPKLPFGVLEVTMSTSTRSWRGPPSGLLRCWGKRTSTMCSRRCFPTPAPGSS